MRALVIVLILASISAIVAGYFILGNGYSHLYLNQQPNGQTSVQSSRLIAPNVTIVFCPDTVEVGKEFNVTWRVDCPYNRTTNHTAARFSNYPIPHPVVSDYRLTEPIKNGTIPGTFTAAVILNTPGTKYVRAYIILDNVSYWSDERTIQVV